MALKMASNLDLMNNELLNFRVQNLGSAPNNPKTGQHYFNTTTNREYVYNGSKWEPTDAIDAAMDGKDIVDAINDQDTKISLGKINVNTFNTTTDGLVPKASESGATSKYLKGDGTWSTPDDTTYNTFNTTTDGLVPKASGTGATSKYLKGDGTWGTPDNTVTTIVDSLESESTTSALSAKQGKTLDGKIATAQSNAESTAKDYVDNKIEALIGSAPTALDTLVELAAALGDDENFSETVLTALGNKTEKYTTNIGDNVKTTFEITHNMNSRAITVQVFQNGSPWAMILCDVELTTVDKVTLKFATAPSTNEFSVVIVG